MFELHNITNVCKVVVSLLENNVVCDTEHEYEHNNSLQRPADNVVVFDDKIVHCFRVHYRLHGISKFHTQDKLLQKFGKPWDLSKSEIIKTFIYDAETGVNILQQDSSLLMVVPYATK